MKLRLNDLFAEYGAIYSMQNSKVLLEQLQADLIQEWKTKINTLDILWDNAKEQALTQELEDVVQQSHPHCPTEVKSPLSLDQGSEVQIQQETKKEQQQEVQQLALKQVEPKKLKPKKLIPWTEELLTSFIHQSNTVGIHLPELFTPNLMMTEHYAYVHDEQKPSEIIGPYLKPVHIILFRLDKNNQLSASLVSNEEAGQIKQLLENQTKSSALPQIWLGTSLHTCLAGEPPENLKNRRDYHTLIEQIRYFNGNLLEILEQPTPLVWLDQQSPEKLEYFREHLMPYRRTEAMHFARLKQLLQDPMLGLDVISNHPFTNLSNFDWKQQYPKALPVEIATLTHLAQAIDHANQNFSCSIPIEQDLPPVLLSKEATMFYEAHQEILHQHSPAQFTGARDFFKTCQEAHDSATFDAILQKLQNDDLRLIASCTDALIKNPNFPQHGNQQKFAELCKMIHPTDHQLANLIDYAHNHHPELLDILYTHHPTIPKTSADHRAISTAFNCI